MNGFCTVHLGVAARKISVMIHSPVYDGAGLIREVLQVHYWMWRGAPLVTAGTDVSETCRIADRLENCNPFAGVSVAVARRHKKEKP